MPSPFPGMNPYLEHPTVWPDFHSGYINALRLSLSAQLLPRYLVRVEEQVYIHELPDGPTMPAGRPDLSITGQPPPAGPAGRVVVAPATIQLPLTLVEEHTTRRLVVVGRNSDRVVTAIELLSPTNKAAGPDRDQYLNKRTRLMYGGANFVEIDLLRGGTRSSNRIPACAYAVVVARTATHPRADVWPVRLDDRLPVVPIPLQGGEPEAELDLQSVLHQVYDAVGYQYFVYRHPPDPPLTPEQAAWAADLLPPEAAR